MTASQKEQEFRKLMTEHGGLVAKVCYMYATDSEHVKDLLQEVRINICHFHMALPHNSKHMRKLLPSLQPS